MGARRARLALGSNLPAGGTTFPRSAGHDLIIGVAMRASYALDERYVYFSHVTNNIHTTSIMMLAIYIMTYNTAKYFLKVIMTMQ